MIPVLYDSTEKQFTSNGIGRLSNAIACYVDEQRNGQYMLSMTYPLAGKYFEDVKEGNFIFAKPSQNGREQPFRIFNISKPIDGEVQISAEHISYMLSKIPVGLFTAGSAPAAMAGLKTNALCDCPFDFWTDKATVASFSVTEPISIRAKLGGTQGSILDAFGGGEYEFDRFTVKLYQDRGADNGVTIRYGKNLIDLTAETSDEDVFTGVVPFWKGTDEDNNDVLVMLPENIVWSEHKDEFPYQMAVPLDLSSEWEQKPTEAQVRNRAQNYLRNTSPWLIKSNLTVNFVELAKMEDYKDISALESVNLCDTVTVIHPDLGIEAKAKVISTRYNVLTEEYESIELGNPRTDLGDFINAAELEAQKAVVEAQKVKTFAQIAIEVQTNLIRGGLGGHVVMKANADGLPEEILVMDTEDVSTAVKVWRWNMGGFAFSNNGYDGPFDKLALTADGQINADTITTGVLNALLIRAGVLTDGVVTYTQFSGSTFIAGQEYFEKTGSGDVPTYELTNDSTPRAGKTYYTQTITANTSFDLATGELKMSKGEINLGKISGTDNYNFTVNDQGQLVARDATIYGTVQSVSNESYYDYKQKKTINYTRKTEIESGQITFYANGIGLGEMYSGFYSQYSEGTIEDAVKYIGVSSEGGLFLRTRGGQSNPYIDLMGGYIDINNDGMEIWINPRDMEIFSSTGSTATQAMYIDQYGVVGMNQLKLGNYSNAVNFENLWVADGELGIGTSGGDFWVDDINNAVDYGNIILPTSIRENGEIATYITVRIERGRIKS